MFFLNLRYFLKPHITDVSQYVGCQILLNHKNTAKIFRIGSGIFVKLAYQQALLLMALTTYLTFIKFYQIIYLTSIVNIKFIL